MPAASPAAQDVNSMSAEEQSALLKKLLAAQSQQQPVVEQSADLILGQVGCKSFQEKLKF